MATAGETAATVLNTSEALIALSAELGGTGSGGAERLGGRIGRDQSSEYLFICAVRLDGELRDLSNDRRQ